MERIKVREFRDLLRRFERALDAQVVSGCCCCVTVTQCHLLLELEKENNITLNELASKLKLDKSTVSRTVESLVNSGYISRDIPSNNRRTVLISLTEQGKAQCNSIHIQNDRYYENALLQVSDEHILGLVEGLKTLSAAMETLNNKSLE